MLEICHQCMQVKNGDKQFKLFSYTFSQIPEDKYIMWGCTNEGYCCLHIKPVKH